MIDLLLVVAKWWSLMCSLLALQHTAVLQLDAATATSFFGVYDGHGGSIFNPSSVEQVLNAWCQQTAGCLAIWVHCILLICSPLCIHESFWLVILFLAIYTIYHDTWELFDVLFQDLLFQGIAGSTYTLSFANIHNFIVIPLLHLRKRS